MRPLLILALITILSPFLLFGNEKTNLANQLFNLYTLQIDQGGYELRFNNLWPSVEAQILGENEVTEETQILLNNLKNKILEDAMENLKSEEFKGDLLNVYMSIFSEREIKALLNFYSSQEGKDILKKSNELYTALYTLLDKYTTSTFNVHRDDIEKLVTIIKFQNVENPKLLGDSFLENNECISAITLYEIALKNDSNDPELLNNLAWALITCSNEKYYDPQRAIQLSEQALKLKETSYILDTLATAYAETGNFSKSVEILQYILSNSVRFRIDNKHLPYYQDCLTVYQNHETCLE
jgi:hypothetical protein